MQRVGVGHLMLFEMAVVIAHADIQAAIGDQPVADEWILRPGVHRDEFVIAGVIGKGKTRHPFQGFEVPPSPGALQLGEQLAQRGARRHRMETADARIDRMNLAAAHHPNQGIAGLLDREPVQNHLAMLPRHRDRVGIAEEIRRVEEEHVQGMAFDPFAAVQQPAQGANGGASLDTQRVFDRGASAHLVSDRADAADARRDIGDLGVGAAAQEGLEEARRLEDAQLHVAHLIALKADPQRALALHARQVIDLNRLHGAFRRRRETRRHWR